VRPTLPDLLQHVGEVTVVGLHLPIGLPDDSRRDADLEVRRFLTGRSASAVVTTPVREAVYAETYGEANAISRERTGAGVAKEAFDRRRQIAEVDRWLRQDLPFTVVEVHPEAALAVMAGTPLASRRRTAEGSAERRDTLARAGVYVPTVAPGGAVPDEVIGACAAAWSAHRVKTGQALSFPAQPQTFSDGLPSAIRV
jgi:predicted RNase H-like nuclease